MAAQWQSITNKKLHSARLQLDGWEISEPHQSDAYRDAFLLHAVLAYRSMIAEVMESYGCRADQLPELSDAIDALKVKGQVSSEINQLIALTGTDSWLRHLSMAFDSVIQGNDYQTQSDHSMISLVTVSEDSGDVTQGMKSAVAGQKVLSSLKELVTHFRNFNLEW